MDAVVRTCSSSTLRCMNSTAFACTRRWESSSSLLMTKESLPSCLICCSSRCKTNWRIAPSQESSTPGVAVTILAKKRRWQPLVRWEGASRRVDALCC